MSNYSGVDLKDKDLPRSIRAEERQARADALLAVATTGLSVRPATLHRFVRYILTGEWT